MNPPHDIPNAYNPDAISTEGLERYGSVFSYKCNPADASPAMRHFLEMKADYAEVILLYRMGDFYETFFEDAVIVARALELTLTGKDSGALGKVPMAGVPARALDAYVPRLLGAGFKIAICEQMEDPALAKGIVKRDVVRVLSPGTVIDAQQLAPSQSNYLAAVLLPKSDRAPDSQTEGCSLAYVDVSTGRFFASCLTYSQLLSELERIQPREILVHGKHASSPVPGIRGRWLPNVPQAISHAFTCTPLANDAINNPRNAQRLNQLLDVQDLSGFGLKTPCDDDLIKCCGMIGHYLHYSFMETPIHFDGIKRVYLDTHVRLSANARRNLELLTTTRDGRKEGSLLHILDRCMTPMGQRLLREWVGAPTRHLPELESRLEAVASLLEYNKSRGMLRKVLPNIYDIERLATRLANLTASPRDLSALTQSLDVLPRISHVVMRLEGFYLERLKGFPPEIGQALALMKNALADAPPITLKEGGLIREGFSPELDQLRATINTQAQWLSDFEATERERTGIKSLKVTTSPAIGYLIEVTKLNSDLVPENYTRKQTLKAAERYITPELHAHEQDVLNAQTRLVEVESTLFFQLRQQVHPYASMMKEVAHRLACVDVLQSFAEVSEHNNYTRPHLVEYPILDLKNARHPVLEALLPRGQCVANDTQLQGQDAREPQQHAQVEIITGPNMAGKSTYMRQVALAVVMAHIGCFVPASSAAIGIIDALYTRIGAVDDVSAGQSTFMVEMSETAEILNTATKHSLVILDEVGRGTSTYDGVAIAWSAVEHLVEHIGARTLFATHYHELNILEVAHTPLVKNVRVVVAEQADGSMSFLHRVEAGAAQKSYGIQVAKMAGLPERVLHQATRRLNDMQKAANQQLRQRRSALSGLDESDSQLSIF